MAELSQHRINRALFVGLFLAPLALMSNLSLGYMLSSRSCTSKLSLALHGVTLAALALALIGAFTAWRAWRTAGSSAPGDAGDRPARSRFVAVVGLMFSALCALVILAQGAAQFVYDPCQGSY